MTKLTVGPWVAAQKLPSKDAALDRIAFLERTRPGHRRLQWPACP